MTDRSHLVADAERYMVPTYGRPPFVLDHGQGVEVWDTDGRRYLDFVAGIAVNALGHAHPAIVETMTREAVAADPYLEPVLHRSGDRAGEG